MTYTLQDLIDAAKLCGYEPITLTLTGHDYPEHVFIDVGNENEGFERVRWNPREDGNQQNEIRDALLAKGWRIHTGSYMQSITNDALNEHVTFECPANDFLTLAGAHVWRREHD